MGRYPHAIWRQMVLCLAFGLMPLRAQSFQSSFSEVKFDRAKGPATYHAGVKVDVASGAASMEIPCGPGIGERGLRFSPTLSMRIAPQLGISTRQEEFQSEQDKYDVESWSTQTVDTLYQLGFGSSSFSPGTFDLALLGAHQLGQQSTYSLPGGDGGRILGRVPAAMTVTAAKDLLARFDVTGEIAMCPDYEPSEATVPFIQMGSSGHLIRVSCLS